ncbi:hypothetical protein [Ideonella sp.]|jgi:LPS sulfotransferase NodH|uniref:hypothetical protein n=1 Tax=Ideonella sp. TaxID=1929293 RepID=UPI0037BF54C4
MPNRLPKEESSSISIAIAFPVRPKQNQEWHALLQAASWRHHFGDQVNIHVFLLDPIRKSYSNRIIEGFELLNCEIRVPTTNPSLAATQSDRALLASQAFSENLIIVSDSSLLVANRFPLEILSTLGNSALLIAEQEPYAGDELSIALNKLLLESESTKGRKKSSNALVGASSSLIGIPNQSSWKDHLIGNYTRISKEFPGTSFQQLDKWLPSFTCIELNSSPVELDSKKFGVTPLEGDNLNCGLYRFSDSSELYRSGLNRIASEALMSSGSGFKNLMDLLQRNKISPTKGTAPRLQQSNPEPLQSVNSSSCNPFVIIGAMRTGSNLLQDYLNQCQGIRCYGELFNPAFIESPQHKQFLGISMEQRRQDPSKILQKIVAASSGNPIVGFRFFDNHIYEGLQEWLEKQNIKAVFLTRDPLESYISLQNAIETKQWLLRHSSDRRVANWTFSPDEFLQYCNKQGSFYDRMRREVRALGLPIFQVAYRELHNQAILGGLARYLGSAAPALGFAPTIIKQIDLHPKEFITNYTEISQAVRVAKDLNPSLDWNVSSSI